MDAARPRSSPAGARGAPTPGGRTRTRRRRTLALALLAAAIALAGSAFRRAPSLGVPRGAAGPPPSSPPSVVLVSLDTLRADRLGCYGHASAFTPNLDRLATEAALFERAFSQANTTVQSHASLFTSRYPSELGPIGPLFRLGPRSPPTLAGVLRLYGYRTAAFVAGGHLDPSFGLDSGFEVYDTRAAWGSLYHTFPPALGWLDRRDPARPFFVLVHGYDTHARTVKPAPYGYLLADRAHAGPGQEVVRTDVAAVRVWGGALYPDRGLVDAAMADERRIDDPRAWERLRARAVAAGGPPTVLTRADLDGIRGVYDGAVAYSDAMLGLLLEGLERRGILDRAWVVVLSDHGEQLGERGAFDHDRGVEDEETHVPLLIRPPGGLPGGRRIAPPVELTDVLPTLLEIAGAVPPAAVRGRSLLPAIEGGAVPMRPAAFTQGARRMVSARSGTARLSYSGIEADSPFAADVIEGGGIPGPGFTASPGAPPEEVEALRHALVSWLRSLPPPPASEADPYRLVPAPLRRELQARGYWTSR